MVPTVNGILKHIYERSDSFIEQFCWSLSSVLNRVSMRRKILAVLKRFILLGIKKPSEFDSDSESCNKLVKMFIPKL
jgi:hypothetical protein